MSKRPGVVALVVAGLVLAGCSDAPESESVDSGDAAATGDAGATEGSGGQESVDREDAAPAEGAPEELAQFYEQELEWSDCDGNECVSVTVPMDYESPDGQTLEIEILRVPAEGGDPQGSLLVNPGGPGASGVDYATTVTQIIDSSVLQAYDVVGFDPRGVGSSAPVRCVGDSELDELLSYDPTPDSESEVEEAGDIAEDFAQGCEENVGELLGHLSTVEAARDLDIIRAALDETQLDYLGASYGTYLGATYAELFPDRSGRLVLDGAVDPTLTGTELSLDQAEGFERATQAYVEDCVNSGDCPLGDDPQNAIEQIPALLESLDEDPLPLEDDAAEALTEGWAMYGVIVAMYDQAAWPVLTQALEQAMNGDGSTLMMLANIYADRDSSGNYASNSMQAIYAVNCLDRPSQPEVDDEQVREQFQEASPTWGAYLSGEGVCEYWPAEAQESIEDYSAEGADPILVLGTTRDPATPYEWAESLAQILDSGVLVTNEGDGHTAYGRSSDCIDNAVNNFLLEGTVPEDGLTCE